METKDFIAVAYKMAASGSRVELQSEELKQLLAAIDDPKRVADLIEANNRYLDRARSAEGRYTDHQQGRAAAFVIDRFGEPVLMDIQERIARIVEETLELAQAEGFPANRVATIKNYVYGRAAGDPEQEAGGICHTLLCWAAAKGVSLRELEDRELTRTEGKSREHFAARQNAKAALGIAMPASTGSISTAATISSEPRPYPFAPAGKAIGVIDDTGIHMFGTLHNVSDDIAAGVCPFCSSHGVGVVPRNSPALPGGMGRILVQFVRCYSCGAEGPPASTPTEAIRLWNMAGRLEATKPAAAGYGWMSADGVFHADANENAARGRSRQWDAARSIIIDGKVVKSVHGDGEFEAIEAVCREVAKADKRIAELSDQLDASGARNADLMEQLEASRRIADIRAGELMDMTTARDGTQRSLDKANAAIARLETRLWHGRRDLIEHSEIHKEAADAAMTGLKGAIRDLDSAAATMADVVNGFKTTAALGLWLRSNGRDADIPADAGDAAAGQDTPAVRARAQAAELIAAYSWDRVLLEGAIAAAICNARQWAFTEPLLYPKLPLDAFVIGDTQRRELAQGWANVQAILRDREFPHVPQDEDDDTIRQFADLIDKIGRPHFELKTARGWRRPAMTEQEKAAIANGFKRWTPPAADPMEHAGDAAGLLIAKQGGDDIAHLAKAMAIYRKRGAKALPAILRDLADYLQRH